MAKYCKLPVLDTTLGAFGNTERLVKLNESVRGKRVIIVGTGAGTGANAPAGGAAASATASVNDNFMEMLLLCQGCRRADASMVILVLAYFPYSRSDKQDNRGSIGAKLVTTMLEAVHVDKIISMDLHAGQITGFTDIPFSNLYAITPFCDYLQQCLLTDESEKEKYILVAPDLGAAKRVKAYGERLRMRVVSMEKERDYSRPSTVAKCTIFGATEGLNGKIAIVIDDMVDTMGTMVENTRTLVEHGVKGVIVIATHGILSGPALDRIMQTDAIKSVLVTNTLPVVPHGKITVVPVGNWIGEALRRIMDGESVSAMFSGDLRSPRPLA